MKIYTIYLSEDGLHNEVYTNIKALYNGILNTYYENLCEVGLYKESIKFTYPNLVKKLKESSQNGKYYEWTQILDINGNTKIDIKQMKIKTK